MLSQRCDTIRPGKGAAAAGALTRRRSAAGPFSAQRDRVKLHLSRRKNGTNATVLQRAAAPGSPIALAGAGFPVCFQRHGAHAAALAPSLQ
jgi:hypothetical protein